MKREFFMERRVAFKALVGSHNYNLNHEGSDRDYKIFTIPTFTDLYRSKRETKSIQSSEEDVAYHDIRQLKELLCKSNVNFLEVLFSEELTFGESLDSGEGACLMSLFEHRELIACMNLKYLYQASLGMFMNRYKYLETGTQHTQALVETHGYDTKQAMQCARILDVLIRYERQGFTDFKSAIWFAEEDPERAELIRIREGAYTKDEMIQYLTNKKAYVEQELAPIYRSHGLDTERADWIESQLMTLVRFSLLKELN